MIGQLQREDNTFTKDELRIQAKREANEERRRRFLDARKRLMGIDVEALNMQVAEKQNQKELQKRENNLEKQRMLEIDRILETVEQDEKMQRDQVKNEIMNDWKESITRKANKQEEFVDVDHPSMASAQSFIGEDSNYDERVTLQKQQMKRWVNEDIEYKNQKKQYEKHQEAKYAEMMRAIGDIREAAEKEEQALRQSIRNDVKDYNNQLSQYQKYQRQCENETFKTMSKEDIHKATTLNIPSSRECALDENGRIVRRDMFRGYSEAQTRRIYQENEELIMQKMDAKEDERRLEAAWAEHDALLQKTMEYSHESEVAMRNKLKQDHLNTIRQQMEEQKRARDIDNKQRRGNIGSEFFSGFGNSCR